MSEENKEMLKYHAMYLRMAQEYLLGLALLKQSDEKEKPRVAGCLMMNSKHLFFLALPT